MTLRRLFGIGAGQDGSPDVSRRLGDLERAVEELSADLEWLAGDVKKLRGRVTGGVRSKETLPDAPGPTIPSDPPPRYSPRWFLQQREKLGIPGGVAHAGP